MNKHLTGYALIALATVALLVIVTNLPAGKLQGSVELPGAVGGAR